MFTNIILVTVRISFSFSSFSLENITSAFYFSFKSTTYQHNMHLKYCNCIFSIFVAFWHKIVFPIGFRFLFFYFLFFYLWFCLFSSFNLHLDLCIISGEERNFMFLVVMKQWCFGFCRYRNQSKGPKILSLA